VGDGLHTLCTLKSPASYRGKPNGRDVKLQKSFQRRMTKAGIPEEADRLTRNLAFAREVGVRDREYGEAAEHASLIGLNRK